jgi:hypothetical protein
MTRTLATLIVSSLFLGAAGCRSKVEYSDEFTVSGETIIKIIEGPKRDQTVHIQASAAEPINVIAILTKEVEKAEAQLINGQQPESALGGALNQKEVSFDINVPAGEEFQIFISTATAKSTTVTLSANSQ